jgi:hypothetical protein
MTDSSASKLLADVAQYSPEQRLDYLVKEIVKHQKVWILTDDDGCVMLNTDDEDCAPVWPSEAFAQGWATGEWADCKAIAIDLKTWRTRWTYGLEGDNVAIAVFPGEDEQGLVISAQEFDYELQQLINKKRVN